MPGGAAGGAVTFVVVAVVVVTFAFAFPLSFLPLFCVATAVSFASAGLAPGGVAVQMLLVFFMLVLFTASCSFCVDSGACLWLRSVPLTVASICCFWCTRSSVPCCCWYCVSLCAVLVDFVSNLVCFVPLLLLLCPVFAVAGVPVENSRYSYWYC